MLSPQYRKSSHSAPGGNCLEAGVWLKASYSAPGGNCIEAQGGQIVRVRDSKDVLKRGFAVSPKAWNAFLGLATA